MKFNGIDLGDYSAQAKIVSTASFLPGIKSNYAEIADKAYDFRAYLRPRTIELEVYVTGTSEANLISNLDNISRVLNPTFGLRHLILDFPDDRYYNAKVSTSLEYNIITHKLAQGTVTFVCPDPLGYDNDATSSDSDINADPKTITEVTGGTAHIEPVYTLAAGEDLNAVTIKVENLSSDEELQWIGSLSNGEELEIDVANWIVNKEGIASMSTVTGQFPRLRPSYSNQIKVTAFSTTGTLNIAYRDNYL